MRVSSFPKKKSRLSSQGKAIAAAKVLLDAAAGKLDDKEAGHRLRREVGLRWTFLSAAQYLTGQDAIQAIRGIPEDWSEDGHRRQDLFLAVVLANDLCANAHPRSPLSAGLLVKHFKGGSPGASDP